MTALAYYLLKVIACSGLLFAYYHLALRNKLFHQWNRFYLLTAVVLSLVIPVCQITIEHYLHDRSNSAINLLQVVQSANGYFDEVNVTAQQGFSAAQWVFAGYMTVSFVMLTALAVSLARIYRIIESHSIQWISRIRFLNTEIPGTPFSFLNYIFWNKKINLESETGQQIFEHELVHVQEHHTIDKLFMQVVIIFFWCNPFFWLMRKELKLVHEFIADQKAVAQHGTAAFSAMVLQAAYPEKFHSITNQFFQTSIKRRIAMLNKIQNPRINYLSRLCVLPLLAFVVLAFTVRTKEVLAAGHLNKPFTVVIDAGHGMLADGKYSGAQVDGLAEDEIVLALAKKIKELNNDKNLNVVLTRPADEIVDLHRRVDIARENNADLFISLHMGAMPPVSAKYDNSSNADGNGFDVMISHRMPPYQKKSVIFGSLLAQEISSIYKVNPTLLERQVGIWVLDKNICPAVLLDCGYVTNKKDRDYITNRANQTVIASKILAAVAQYANSKSRFESQSVGDNASPTAGNTINVSTTQVEENRNDSAKPDPLLVIDGKEFGKMSRWKDQLNGDPSNIQSVSVLKDDAAVRKYGEKGKDGVVEITSKDPSKPLLKDKSAQGIWSQDPLVYADGKEIGKYSKLKDRLNEDNLGDMHVWKGDAAIKKFGEKGKEGVIELESKDPSKPILKEESFAEKQVNLKLEPVFTQVETPATIDKTVWRKYLETHLQPIIENAKGARDGQYTVMLQLLIDKTGKVTSVKSLNDPGYHLADRTVKLLEESSPDWKPAMQNGIAVDSYHNQPVTIVITTQGGKHK